MSQKTMLSMTLKLNYTVANFLEVNFYSSHRLTRQSYHTDTGKVNDGVAFFRVNIMD